MAHSQHYPPQAFSPPITNPSPANSNAPSSNYFPPAKRQRISPNPQSPYDSPSFTTLQLPTAGSPVNGIVANGTHSPMAPPPGSMGPPSRPSEKQTDMNEFADVLNSSGIDLREEEAQLNQSYNQTYSNPLLPAAQQNAYANSFNSHGSSFGTLSAGNSFSEQTNRVPGPQATFYGAGSLNQPLLPSKTPEEQAAEKETLVVRRAAERRQHHVNEPFLYLGTVESKLSKVSYENQVQVSRNGLMVPVRNQAAPIEVIGPDGSSIVSTQGNPLITRTESALIDILALLSLACEDRIRGIVEQSATLAKQRKQHSHGVVPAEWVDLAVDESANENTTGEAAAAGALDSAPSPMTAPTLKRSSPLSNYHVVC
jgi:hypothetical protein